jgi:hypothetical protein
MDEMLQAAKPPYNARERTCMNSHIELYCSASAAKTSACGSTCVGGKVAAKSGAADSDDESDGDDLFGEDVSLIA